MVSTFLALVACRISVLLMGYEKINLHSNGTAVKEVTPKGLVMDLMPPDIFTPFQRVSPFPIVIIAVLVTYALCSAGKYFEMIKKAVDACYVLFARMLGIVTYALPVFAGVAVMDLLIRQGFDAGWSLLLVAVIAVVSPLLLVIYYLIRLLAAGIPVKDFVKKLLPLLNENMLIGSSIDAVPFNVRYCARTYGMDRRRLELPLAILSEVILSGILNIINVTGDIVTIAIEDKKQSEQTVQS